MAISLKSKQLLKEWDAVKLKIEKLNEELKPLAEAELRIRKELSDLMFPSKIEGSKNEVELAHGYKVRLTHKVTRKIDEAALSSSMENLIKNNIPVDMLFSKVTKLDTAVYRKLQPEQLALLADVVTTVPQTPVLDIIPPKVKK